MEDSDGKIIKVTNKEIKRLDQENAITNGDRLRIMTSFQGNNIPSRGAKSQLKTLYCREFDKHAIGATHRNSDSDEQLSTINHVLQDKIETIHGSRKHSASPEHQARSPYREENSAYDQLSNDFAKVSIKNRRRTNQPSMTHNGL